MSPIDSMSTKELITEIEDYVGDRKILDEILKLKGDGPPPNDERYKEFVDFMSSQLTGFRFMLRLGNLHKQDAIRRLKCIVSEFRNNIKKTRENDAISTLRNSQEP